MDPQKMNRAVFARQPAHVLMVDFSPPFDMDTCHTLNRTLENFFSLVCNLGGPCRTPLFGLYALGCFPECLFPLQHVRGSFPRLYTAFSNLKNYLSDTISVAPRSSHCVVQGIQEAIMQFKRQSQTLRQVAGFSSQLEITIITARQASVISKQIETVTGNMDLENLKKIQVVSVSDPNNLRLGEDELFEASQSSNNTSTSSDNAMCSIIDVINIDNDELSLENFFKGWLHDCGTDREHLHLTLPAVSLNSEDGSETRKLTLKCDLQERIINPNQFPFQAQYSVQMDAVNGKPIMSSSLNKGTGVSVTIHKMRAVKLIKADSVCESVLYGMPLVVRPTTCWKLDWEELDTNQQNFQALCQLLQDKDLFLLAEMETTEEKAKSTCSFNYRPDPPKPSGYFLLLPSQSMTLLIKSVAVNELMLPCDFQVPTDKPLSDAVNLLSDSLNQLEIEDSFNPLLIKSNLCRSLTSSLLKNTNIGRQNIKRKPNIYDSQMSQTTHATRGRGRGGRGMEGSRGQGKAQYPPVTRQPRNRNVSCIPSHQKRYCPPPPPTSSQDIYAFQDFEDFPTEL